MCTTGKTMDSASDSFSSKNFIIRSLQATRSVVSLDLDQMKMKTAMVFLRYITIIDQAAIGLAFDSEVAGCASLQALEADCNNLVTTDLDCATMVH